MELVALSRAHERALEAFRREFAEAGEEHIPGFLPKSHWTFAETVDGFEAWSRGEDLPEEWVPGTTRFLEHEGRLVGVINLRHWLAGTLREFGGHVGYSVIPSERGKGYATRMLREILDIARGLGIRRLLLTCDPENAASARVIEKCGGILEDEALFETMGHPIRRYWIDV